MLDELVNLERFDTPVAGNQLKVELEFSRDVETSYEYEDKVAPLTREAQTPLDERVHGSV